MAIAYDAVATGSGAGQTFSFNHTVAAGSNRVLILGLAIEDTGGAQLCDASVNGHGMIQVDTSAVYSTSTYLTTMIYQALEADLVTGTNKIDVTCSADPSSGTTAGSMSFSGVAQAPAGIHDHTGTIGSGTTIQLTLTPAVANSWIATVAGCGSGGTYTSTAPLTERYDLALSSTMTSTGGTRQLVDSTSTLVTHVYVPGTAANRQSMCALVLAPYTAPVSTAQGAYAVTWWGGDFQ